MTAKKSKSKKPYETTSKEEPLSADTEKILSALAYPIGIIALVLVIIAKDQNKFAKFHGFQALFWNIAFYILYVVISLLVIPLALSGLWTLSWLGSLITSVLWLAFVILSILFAVQAYQGKAFRVPLAYGFIPASAKL